LPVQLEEGRRSFKARCLKGLAEITLQNDGRASVTGLFLSFIAAIGLERRCAFQSSSRKSDDILPRARATSHRPFSSAWECESVSI
jgi:hypothetical protein